MWMKMPGIFFFGFWTIEYFADNQFNENRLTSGHRWLRTTPPSRNNIFRLTHTYNAYTVTDLDYILKLMFLTIYIPTEYIPQNDLTHVLLAPQITESTFKGKARFWPKRRIISQNFAILGNVCTYKKHLAYKLP